MKIVWLGGNHPRHLYVVNQLHHVFPLSGAVIGQRENLLPSTPTNLSDLDMRNFETHFRNRQKSEEKYFGNPPPPDCPHLEIAKGEMNSKKVIDFISEIKPDAAFIFGCELIRSELRSVLPKWTINIHLGLSPRYRGGATLFWPLYFLEPNYCGSTFHFLIDEPDAGEIVHQVQPTLVSTDRTHDVACKTVLATASGLVDLFKILEERKEWKSKRQKASGKNFLARDFRPEHLRLVYNVFNDDIVRAWKEGEINPPSPNLVNQHDLWLDQKQE